MAADAPYHVEILPSAVKDTRRFARPLLERIYTVLAALGRDPFPAGTKKLRGYEGVYRIRVGQYRILYEVGESVRIVSIIRIAHRSSVYRGV